jgi:hypothetical protein
VQFRIEPAPEDPLTAPVTGYRVYRSTNSDGSGAQVAASFGKLALDGDGGFSVSAQVFNTQVTYLFATTIGPGGESAPSDILSFPRTVGDPCVAPGAPSIEHL